MANHIALLDKLKSPTRYFLVHNLVFQSGQCTTVELLDLATRRLIRYPYADLLQLIEEKKLTFWTADY